ncbi:hypothetical protein PAECIP111893_04142 [Paenibacillus plantiphilus]|uniref:HTH merR-type domain-containing protein n=1 Tax=Paenibacillus plantiphilus TaxID=2905650 RepID=A0ABN8GTN3_9BACL|nr:hypothetical protein PAECIP111893_04142 [Paenibacillus plantiphilus]
MDLRHKSNPLLFCRPIGLQCSVFLKNLTLTYTGDYILVVERRGHYVEHWTVIQELYQYIHKDAEILRRDRFIGLLKPAKVADSGYRYYSNEEIRVLQHIAALKELGFTLASIKEMSSTGKDAQEQRWRDYLDFELAAVVEERKRLDGGAVSMLRIVFVLLLLAYIIGFEIVWQWK